MEKYVAEIFEKNPSSTVMWKKDKVFLVFSMNAFGGNRGVGPLILNLCSR